jgi:hypothetical protein
MMKAIMHFGMRVKVELKIFAKLVGKLLKILEVHGSI